MFLRRPVCLCVTVSVFSLIIFLCTQIQEEAVPKLISPDAVRKPVLNNEVRNSISKDNVSQIITVEETVPQNSCLPKTNIMFVRLHKTGTSTIQNLLFRFALKNNLIVAMLRCFNLMLFTEFHRNNLFPLKPGNQYNIFTEHAIFNYNQARAVMPADTKYVAIVRNPVAQFESGYGFFNFSRMYGMNITAYALLNRSDPDQRELQNKRAFNFGRNQQAFDLGMDPELFDDETAVLEKIQQLDEQLDLVMITNRMDESLILLKEELCWKDLDDIVSVKRNARGEERKVKLSPEVAENIKEIHRADVMIYNHFYAKFNERLKKFGADRMKDELKRLETAREKVLTKCENEPEGEDICANLLRFGNAFLREIFTQQRPFYDVTDFELKVDELVRNLLTFMREKFILKVSSLEPMLKLFSDFKLISVC